MSTSAVMPLPLFRTNAHILRLPFELLPLADIVINIIIIINKPLSLSGATTNVLISIISWALLGGERLASFAPLTASCAPHFHLPMTSVREWP